jgi:hypothetical protein
MELRIFCFKRRLSAKSMSINEPCMWIILGCSKSRMISTSFSDNPSGPSFNNLTSLACSGIVLIAYIWLSSSARTYLTTPKEPFPQTLMTWNSDISLHLDDLFSISCKFSPKSLWWDKGLPGSGLWGWAFLLLLYSMHDYPSLRLSGSWKEFGAKPAVPWFLLFLLTGWSTNIL